MDKYWPTVFTLSFLLTCPLQIESQNASNPSQCEITEEVRLQLLKMSFDDFDQGDQGWRLYESPVCYVATAGLIDRYLEAKKDLTTREKQVLRFHSGQMYGFSRQHSLARERFLASFRQEPETDGVPWNDYVRATIAFIDRDLSTLKDHRNRIAASTTQMNLRVVDDLIQFFNERYMVAYTGGPVNPEDALLDLLVWHRHVRIDPEVYSPVLKREVELHLNRAMAHVSKRTVPPLTEARMVRAAEVNYEHLLVAVTADPLAATLAATYVDALRPCYEWKGVHDCPERQAMFADKYQATHPDGPFSTYLPLLAAHRWLCTAEAYEKEMRTVDAERSRRLYEQRLSTARGSRILLIRTAAERLAARGRCFAS